MKRNKLKKKEEDHINIIAKVIIVIFLIFLFSGGFKNLFKSDTSGLKPDQETIKKFQKELGND